MEKADLTAAKETALGEAAEDKAAKLAEAQKTCDTDKEGLRKEHKDALDALKEEHKGALETSESTCQKDSEEAQKTCTEEKEALRKEEKQSCEEAQAAAV